MDRANRKHEDNAAYAHWNHVSNCENNGGESGMSGVLLTVTRDPEWWATFAGKNRNGKELRWDLRWVKSARFAAQR